MNMRQVRILLLLLLMVGRALFAAAEHSEDPSLNPSRTKTLTVCFSHAGDNYAVGTVEEGNTKVLVKHIVEKTGCDAFEIVSLKNYDLPYAQLTQVVREEQEQNEWPEYRDTIQNMERYDTVIVCGPIWWGTYPRVMFTFFSRYDLNGKTVIPVTTHEGSGMGRVREELTRLYPKATVTEGFCLYGHEVRSEEGRRKVDEWLHRLGY